MDAVSRARLWDNQAGILIPASVASLSPDEVEEAWNAWQPLVEGFVEKTIEQDAKSVTGHVMWSWGHKANVLRRDLVSSRIIGIHRSNSKRMEGMAFLTVDGASSPITGLPLVYIDYLSVSPWNDRHFTSRPEYKLVGSYLLSAASLISRRLRLRGRIGLHSLEQAESFYVECGMIDHGFHQDKGMRYFEKA